MGPGQGLVQVPLPKFDLPVIQTEGEESSSCYFAPTLDPLVGLQESSGREHLQSCTNGVI